MDALPDVLRAEPVAEVITLVPGPSSMQPVFHKLMTADSTSMFLSFDATAELSDQVVWEKALDPIKG